MSPGPPAFPPFILSCIGGGAIITDASGNGSQASSTEVDMAAQRLVDTWKGSLDVLLRSATDSNSEFWSRVEENGRDLAVFLETFLRYFVELVISLQSPLLQDTIPTSHMGGDALREYKVLREPVLRFYETLFRR
ncbi:hypothetical protein EV182_004292, partial [Spiromyces aspiralis]